MNPTHEGRPTLIRICIVFAALVTGGLAHAYSTSPARPTDLSGYWRLNVAASDNAEAMLQERLEDERKQRERWARRAREQSELGLPPLDAGIDEASETERQAAAPGQPIARRNRRHEPLRRMLGETQILEITQTASKMEILSEAESRRFEAGSRSQVSMPEGELADSEAGWDGEWFVIERRVRRGPRVSERYRIVKKTGQLEYQIAWSGDHLLAGIKVRRIFDRAVKSVTPPDPALGPVR